MFGYGSSDETETFDRAEKLKERTAKIAEGIEKRKRDAAAKAKTMETVITVVNDKAVHPTSVMPRESSEMTATNTVSATSPLTGLPVVETTVSESLVRHQIQPIDGLEVAVENTGPLTHEVTISQKILIAKEGIQTKVVEQIDATAMTTLNRGELFLQISELVREVIKEESMHLNQSEINTITELLIDDMIGLGPLEPLLNDETVTDIMVNAPDQVYVERNGLLEKSNIEFRDRKHISNIATRIATRIGRRIDESSPMVDARLEDGSRVNIVFPPLAFKSPTIAIRKFPEHRVSLDNLIVQGNLSEDMANLLKVATRSRLNILISGGTGSGKTTMLNAMSSFIDIRERIVTIEDAAELNMAQPHVVSLETRPPNLEGTGEVTIRDLLKNALRMRPDRIIVGEVRADEAIDMLQAMNTGHDGSLGTIHANNPRDALLRLESLVALSGTKLPTEMVRTQIASAIDMIVQVSRMHDGVRRVVQITEIVGTEGDVIVTQDLFNYKFTGKLPGGKLDGKFEHTGLRPHAMPKFEEFGLASQAMPKNYEFVK